MTVDLNELEPFGQDVGFGYLDSSVRSPRQFQPQLILNTKSDSMLRALRRELKYATSFTFSVAFVSPRAIALLKQEFSDFVGVGRIITSDYLGFNSPRAFSELLNLKNLGIDVRLHSETAFHPKGYVFQRPEGVTAILGSSNLTESALASNHEWNLRVSATRESNLATQFSNLLDEELFASTPLTQEWIDAYTETYRPPSKPITRVVVGAPFLDPALNPIAPNEMQSAALAAIAMVRAQGKDRALVISATGTGKTILSALDVRSVNPARLLFLAHREQILDRAAKEFQRVLDLPTTEFGKLAGTSRQTDRRYLFATVQTLSQENVLAEFDRDAFDYILIDEVHRAGAASFARVIEHFRPKFLLGMTATPERGDGESIFEIFDFNVPYEIRLNEALKLDMLSPFHYYGVADMTFEGGDISTEPTDLKYLIASERVEHIVRALDTYGQSGIRPCGLMFCSRKEEARELSEILNQRLFRGERLRTVALTGDDSIDLRERTVERLEAGELDYILTVDVFNEGVDIPSINQVVMLRQTQSSIVFVQQLGRGLRKAPGKDYLVVIDFIGNYANNYLIPIALFGDDSLNKESLRKNLIAAEEIGVIAGLSSVRFDRIAQERVLRSLAQSKLDSLTNLKAAIETIHNRVGRVPKLSDFLRFESVDPILLATKLGNYQELLAKLKIQPLQLDRDQSLALCIASKELLSAKRSNELLLLRLLLSRGEVSEEEIADYFDSEGASSTYRSVASTIRSLTLGFNTATEVEKFEVEGPATKLSNNHVKLTDSFATAYSNSRPFREGLDDLVDTGLTLIANRYRSGVPFTQERQYSRKDVSRLLDWSSNMYSTIYGYKIDIPTQSCPIFVTLHKSSEVSASTAYGDELIDINSMVWYSRSKRNLNSADVRPIVENSVALHIFAKKDDAEGSDFYYLGRAQAQDAEETVMQGEQPFPIVRMTMRFDEPITAGLFDYFQPEVVETS